MSVEFKSPTPEQALMMQEFGALIGQAIDVVVKHDVPHGLPLIGKSLKEAMFWHSDAVLNKPEPVISVVMPEEKIDDKAVIEPVKVSKHSAKVDEDQCVGDENDAADAA